MYIVCIADIFHAWSCFRVHSFSYTVLSLFPPLPRRFPSALIPLSFYVNKSYYYSPRLYLYLFTCIFDFVRAPTETVSVVLLAFLPYTPLFLFIYFFRSYFVHLAHISFRSFAFNVNLPFISTESEYISNCLNQRLRFSSDHFIYLPSILREEKQNVS